MIISENDQIIPDETTTADTMTKLSVNITKKLKLKPTETEIPELTLSKILERYKDHQSIVKSWSQINDNKNLILFKLALSKEVPKTTSSLKNNKGSLS